MKEIIDKLRKDDEAWVQYLWPGRGRRPSRKLAYVKKSGRRGDPFGRSDFFLATPIWMKE